MIRKIDDLLLFNVNFDITSNLKYQELMSLRKLKIEEEELPEHLLDESTEELPSWEYIEEQSWNLMKKSGMNWHLFVLWLESNISAEGFDDCLIVLNAFKNVVLKKHDLLCDNDNEKSDEKKLLLIEYFDKSISRALMYSYVKHEFPLVDYIYYKNNAKHDKLFDVLSVITEKDYDTYRDIIESCKNLIDSCENLFPTFTIHCSKVKETLIKLDDIMNIYEEHFMTIEEDNEDDEKKSEVLSNVSYYNDSKEEAYKKIAEALEILKKQDQQNLAIPLLRKIMRWNSLNISEILNEINDRDGAHFVMKFLMD